MRKKFTFWQLVPKIVTFPNIRRNNRVLMQKNKKLAF